MRISIAIAIIMWGITAACGPAAALVQDAIDTGARAPDMVQQADESADDIGDDGLSEGDAQRAVAQQPGVLPGYEMYDQDTGMPDTVPSDAAGNME